MHRSVLYHSVLLLTIAALVVPAHDTAWAADADSQQLGADADSQQRLSRPISERFQGKLALGEAVLESPTDLEAPTQEVPDFQRHVTPLLGRLGCNGRACHGSFQGQGGFRLSLFGYDFAADHEALLEEGAGRVDLDDRLESMLLTMPVDDDAHGGGKRFEIGSWEYWVLRNWVQAGAEFKPEQVQKLQKLEVSPVEIQFAAADERQPLQVVAEWEDGTREDVTCLCRFHSNDSAIADIDATGQVTSGEAGDTHVVVSYDNAVVPVLVLRPLSTRVGDDYPRVATPTEVDRLVVDKLKKLGIVPSDVCTDSEFLRRASLDVTGTLPTSEEVVEFLQNESPGKRHAKIEELLARPAYAARWTTFLCDITGNNDDQLRNFLPAGIRADQQWYQWILKRVDENVSYDRIVEGMVTASSREPNESYRDYCESMSEICRDASGQEFADRSGMVHFWARNNFRTAEERAIGFAYSFLGVRIQCAQCHKHPFDQWSKQDFDSFELLFGAVQAQQNSLMPDAKADYAKMLLELDVDKSLKGGKLRGEFGKLLKQGEVIPFPELVVNARAQPRGRGAKAKAPQAKLLGSDWVEMDGGDARGALMDWLRAPDNPYFSRAIVNRIWAQYFEVGIVNPADDLNLANAPSNAPLLDYLATGFRDSGFDMKWLHREILTSDTYQRSWQPNATNASDKHNFSHSILRRLPAESTYDAVRMALVNDELARDAQNLETPRAILQAGSSARQLGGRDDTSYALSVFGRSVRESNCDCDRSNEPSLLQTVFLLNDEAVQGWLSDPKTSWVSAVAKKYGWEKLSVSPADKARQQQLQQTVKRLNEQNEVALQRIAEAERQGQTQRVEQLKRRQSESLAQARRIAKKNGLQQEFDRLLSSNESESGSDATEAGSKADGISAEQAIWITENAYLRSLSREPTADEIAVAVSYLRSEDKPAAAVEGLLWSLINTKEFILNH